MRRVHRRRLLRLAKFLRRLAPRRFNFAQWIDRNSWKGKADLSCGTSACAVGWATTIPQFRRLGLRFRVRDTIWGSRGDLVLIRNKHVIENSVAAIVRRVFGPEAVRSRLFWPDENPECLDDDASPREVAAMIERFVERCGEAP